MIRMLVIYQESKRVKKLSLFFFKVELLGLVFSELFPLGNKYYTKLCCFQKERIWSVQNQCKDMITIFQNVVQARWLVTHQKCPRTLSTSKESLLILSGCLTAWAHGDVGLQIPSNLQELFVRLCLPPMQQWYGWTLLEFIHWLQPWITCHWNF